MCGQKKNHSGGNVPPPPPPYPGHGTGYGDNKGQTLPPYTLANMQSSPYGVSAAHIPAPFSPEMKPGTFNVWGITGYTGNIETSAHLDPTQTSCHLAKIQQAMTGYNRFNPHKFSPMPSPAAPTSDDNDKPQDQEIKKEVDIPKFPEPSGADLKNQQAQYASYSGYYPGYGHNFGLAPPPCPPEPPKDKKTNKCRNCAGASGHPIKRIKKMNYELLCWACVWRAYASSAEEVWKESEDVEGDGDE